MKQKINTVASDYYSTLKTKTVVESGTSFDKFPRIDNVPKDLEMDFSRILNKPFLIDIYNWTASTTVYSNLFEVTLPTALLSNALASVPFTSSALFRMKMCVLLQVSGTPMHQGLLLAGVIPSQFTPIHPTQLLMAPHTFLNANESTSVCIEVPFYQRTPLGRTNITGPLETGFSVFDYAKLSVMVMDPLSSSGTASSTLSISVHAIITEAEFYVPKISDLTWIPIAPPAFKAEGFIGELVKIPTKIFDGLAQGAKQYSGDFIDALRLGLREFTGFHNPNSTTMDSRMLPTLRNFANNVDQPTLIEKLDPYAQFDRVVQDYQFNTGQDEMDLHYILSKPAFMGKFQVNTTTASGDLLMSHPIAPRIESNAEVFYSPIRLFYDCSRYWKGSLKLHLQAVMTNFHYCKLLVVRDYSGNQQLLTSYPSMGDTHNLITDTLEFSAGGQIQTIDLPFCSQLEQIECSKWPDWIACNHGMVYVYLLQPLTTNGTVPTTVTFNAYMSVGDDFQYYGYGVDQVVTRNNPPTTFSDNSSFKAEASSTPVGESITVDVSSQQPLTNHMTNVNEEDLRVMDFKPIVSVRDYLRRFTYFETRDIPANGVMVRSIQNMVVGSQSFANAIRKLFFGFYGGYRIKALVKGPTLAAVYYVPPGSSLDITTGLPRPTTANSSWTATKLAWNPPSFPSGRPGTMFQELPITRAYVSEVANATTTEFEFVIPNMNPYRFIGGKGSFSDNSSVFDGAMGEIVVVTPTNTDPSLWKVEFYAAITDETRLGFQVFSNGFRIPFITVGTDTFSNSAFATTVGGTLKGPPVAGVLPPAAYYFNLP